MGTVTGRKSVKAAPVAARASLPDTRADQPERGEAAVWLPIAELIPWRDNPKKPTKAEIAGVAASIRKFGFGAPVVARSENREIIAGHTRVLAAGQAGLTEVPVRLLDLSERDAHVLALADNELGADWNGKLLDEQVALLDAEEKLLAGFVEKNADDVTPQLEGLEYRVVVECAGEDAQTALLEKLEAEGYTCSPLIS